MTVLEFTNSVDGTINDFTSGIITEKEFRSGIMDILFKVAEPRLEDDNYNTLEYRLLNTYFCKPVENGLKQFFQPHDLLKFLDNATDSKYGLTAERIGKALVKMQIEKAYHRIPYERVPVYGYWLSRI